jgi:regulator of replication initiation timing
LDKCLKETFVADTQQELLELIDKLVLGKTLSLEAIEQVQEVRRLAKDTQTRLEGVVRDNDKLRVENQQLRKIVSEHEKDQAALDAKVIEVVVKEKAADKAMILAEADKKIADAAERFLRTVFAPNTIRETLMKTVPVVRSYAGGGGDYVTSETSSEHTDRRDGSDT